jgi:phosphatidate phosphatase APP1
MVLGGVLKSLTQGTQAYKTDRMKKIHGWLPTRQFICVGDSTQSDPEAYAEMYKKFPGWIVSYSVSFKTRTILPPRQFQSGAWHASGML